MGRQLLIITGIMAGILLAGTEGLSEEYLRSRQRMVEEQIETRGVKDTVTLNAMLKVPRHLFVPSPARGLAYIDRPLGIGHGQTISQPYIVAYMTEALKLTPGDRVLEIGTGSGYQAAVLAEIVREVYTIEIVEPLFRRSGHLLRELGYENVYVRYGDGYKGWPEEAPFDAIIVTAAPPEIPEELVRQLKEGGRMIVPVGKGYQRLFLITRQDGKILQEPLLPVRFVPMVKEQ